MLVALAFALSLGHFQFEPWLADVWHRLRDRTPPVEDSTNSRIDGQSTKTRTPAGPVDALP